MGIVEFIYPDLKKIVIAKIFIIPMLLLDAIGMALLDIASMLGIALAVYLFACVVTYNYNNAEEMYEYD